MEIPILIIARALSRGRARTRLARSMGDRHAHRLTSAFLTDTWNQVSSLPWARPVLVEAHRWLEPRAAAGEVLDEGDRLERMFRLALTQAPFALAITADSPGIPLAYLEEARGALERSDGVLGPSTQGGFYLMGLRSCPQGLFKSFNWRAPETFRRLLGRLESRDFTVRCVPPWFQVRQAEDLSSVWLALHRWPERLAATARALTAS